MKTGVNATKLAIAAFVVPYIFAMNPSMLLMNEGFLAAVEVIITSLLGIFAMAGRGLTRAVCRCGGGPQKRRARSCKPPVSLRRSRRFSAFSETFCPPGPSMISRSPGDGNCNCFVVALQGELYYVESYS
jgi:hypothetical protein